MKNIFKLALCSLFLISSASAYAVNGEDKTPVELAPGKVVYALPQTSLSFKVGVEVEKYQPGPYAMYAKKYLGIDAAYDPYTHYNIVSISVTPYVEADPSVRFVLSLTSSSKIGNLLRLTNQGLVAMSDDYSGREMGWRFAEERQVDVASAVSSNLTEKTSSLYRTQQSGDGSEWVPLKQSQVVQKSLESKARETADLIFMLREKRLDIITGNTDAVFDGEAMTATLNEIARLEESYISMFLGRKDYDLVYSYVDAVPAADEGAESGMIVPFRFSEEDGVVSADDVTGGRPVTMEYEFERLADLDESGSAFVPSQKSVYYRIPTVTRISVLDGDELLLETRLPIYQFGRTVSIPL